jgi:hypothetical protein
MLGHLRGLVHIEVVDFQNALHVVLVKASILNASGGLSDQKHWIVLSTEFVIDNEHVSSVLGTLVKPV